MVDSLHLLVTVPAFEQRRRGQQGVGCHARSCEVGQVGMGLFAGQ